MKATGKLTAQRQVSVPASEAWVPMLALAEAFWVLDAACHRNPTQIAVAIDRLVNRLQRAGTSRYRGRSARALSQEDEAGFSALPDVGKRAG